MKVVIAEKPSVARDIAKVLVAKDKKDGYYEGNGWQVTWAYGHLVGLCEPESYGWGTPWKKEALPMIPDEFMLQLLEDGQAKSKKDDRYFQQYSIIKKLFNEAEYIVCATDAGREGELIFRNIYNHMKCKTPFKRLWISSLTDSAIKQGFDNLKEGSDFDNTYYSAESRAKADWLIGMNATRSLTLANPNKGGVFPIGRVQTPTFSFVCGRYYENKNFVQSYYYKLKAKLSTSDNIQFFANCPDSFETKEDAASRIQNLGKTFNVVKKENKTVKEKAPLPFSLTDLQRTANKDLGMSAQETLSALQNLYEAKMTTYPRTDSSYLAEDMIDPISQNVGTLTKLGFLTQEQKLGVSHLIKDGIKKACFDNSKLTDHHAVIPTFENYDNFVNLKAHEQNIYKLVVKRFIQSLLPVCVKEQLTYTLEAQDKTIFKCSGSKTIDEGWRITQTKAEANDKEEDENVFQNLPILMEGEDINVLDIATEEKQTKRPPLLTEAELLKLMETAGKMIEDKELSKAIKDCGLGTPATRASIIESLKSRNMIEVKDKKYLVPTERGLAIYDGVKNLDISKPDVTGDWESKLNKIAEGSYESRTFLNEICERTKSLVTEFATVSINVESNNKSLMVTEDMKCPLCGGKIIESQKTVRCSNYIQDDSNSCQFLIFKSNKYHTFTPKEISELVSNLETSDIITLTTSDKSYNVRFKFDKEKNKIDFIYDNSVCDCPKCGKKVIEYKGSFTCSGNTKENPSCDFLIWKNQGGHELTKTEFMNLLKDKTLKNLSFETKEGKTYKANLVLKEDFSIERVFEVEKVCDCPKCGSPVREFNKGFSCVRNTTENPECDFLMWKEVSGYTIDKKDLSELLSKKCLKDRKFISKDGNPYRANLTLLSDYKVKIEIPEKAEVGVCPKCGSPVKENTSTFCCSKNRKENPECDFFVFKNFSGHTLTTPQIQTLLKGEVLKKVKLVSKEGKNYEADLVLDGNKITFAKK